MNYTEHFIKCRGDTSNPSLDSFYKKPVSRIPVENFGENYINAVKVIASQVKVDLDSEVQEGIMINHNNLWKFEYEMSTICNSHVPYLEKNKYGCPLYVDKIYIYRTCQCERSSSYLWHYDNNPKEMVKNIIYLNDVDNNNSPFEYLVTPDGEGILAEPTRFGPGPGEWMPAPNNSRIPESTIEQAYKQGYSSKKVTGEMGTTYAFSNDAIHRANPVVSGYRDVINIRVKPTMKKVENYMSKKHTTSFETSGAANPNPEVM